MAYSRPIIRDQVFFDAAGNVIDYGHRWPGSPDESTYSVTAHPERFASLHVVAKALIEHLGAPIPDIGVAVRIDPPNADAAPMEFTLTPFPGMVLRAGRLFIARFPFCGCDACDESAPQLVDELEETVFAIIAGGLAETVGGYRIELASGWRGSNFDPADHLPGLTDGGNVPLAPRDWAPWHPASD
jgi:Family of unknown function (DUF6226)